MATPAGAARVAGLWATEGRASQQRVFLRAMLVRSTYARHRIRHAIRHTAVLAGAPSPSCPKRPFTTHADRLRPRLEGRRLPVAGSAGGAGGGAQARGRGVRTTGVPVHPERHSEFLRGVRGIEEPRSKSRASGIPRVFKFLVTMDVADVERMLDDRMFSGPAQFGPVADAIRGKAKEYRDAAIDHS